MSHTKEEILESHYPDLNIKTGWIFAGAVEDVFKAMDEHSRQQAIEFSKWIYKYGGRYHSEGKMVLDTDPEFDIIDPKVYTLELLYSLFTTHQSQQK